LRSIYFDNQKLFAKRIGVGKSTVGMWELGRNFPRPKYWDKILSALKCNSLDVLFKPLIENIQSQSDPIVEEICQRIKKYCEVKPDFKVTLSSWLDMMKLPSELISEKEQGEGGGDQGG